MPRGQGASQPPDAGGLQQERTVLAWRRTGLALLVAAVVIARLSFEPAGLPGLLLAGFAGALAAWAVLATLRGRRWSTTSESGPAPGSVLRDGKLPGLLALVAGLLCLTELGIVLIDR